MHTFSLRLAAVLVLAAGPALADVIDGDWCSQDGKGRHFQINGSTIITPGGHQATGDYGRHTFAYSVPPSEPSAGQTITMRLMNETTVDLWVGDVSKDLASAEVWKRCTPVALGAGRNPIAG